MAADEAPRSPAAALTGAEPHAPARPVRTGLSLCVPVFAVALLLLLLVGAVAGGLRWMLATETGTTWLLQQLGGTVQAQGWRGALLGSGWQAERLRVQWDGGRQSVLIEDLKAEGLQWQWRPQPQAWVGLRVGSLAARSVTLDTGPKKADSPPPKLPAALQQPLRLQVDRLALQRFVLGPTTPAAAAANAEMPPLLQDLLASGLHFRPEPGALHAIEQLQLQSHGVALQGSASLANAQPYTLKARATARPVFGEDSPAWAAVAQAEGPLETLAMRATLRGRAPPRGEAPALDLQAQLKPLQAWLLAGLDLRTEALDLAAITPQAPATRLSGSATLQGGAAGQPLLARVNLDNGLPGRWNEGRLPLRRVQLEAAGSLQQPGRVALPRFELLLADATASAGRYSGSAVWQGTTLTLESQLQDLAPQRIDSRAAAMTLTGPLALTLRGLPSPDPRAAPPAAGDKTAGPGITWKLDLQGRLEASPLPVQVQLEGSADDQRLVLRRATAQAGRAEASLTATLQRLPAGDWQLATSGSVTDFDPVPWWPGEAGSAWRQGPHRLSGGWQFDVRLPRKAETLKPLVLAQRLAGNGALRVRESMIAGVAMSADVSLGYTQAAAPVPAVLRAELQLGGNALRLEARGDPLGEGASDRWSAEIDAASLGTLGPLARLVPALAAWAPTGGSIAAKASADGRWPAMRTEGQASLQRLQLGALSVARGAATWQLASEGSQALSLQAELADIRRGTQRADLLRAKLSGTLADHKLQVLGAVPLMPPRWAEQMLALPQRQGTQAQLQGSGQWAPAAEGGGTWRGRLDRLTLGAWDGQANEAAPAAPAAAWLDTSNLRAELGFAPGGSLVAVKLSPGRVRLGDSVALRWDEVRADLRGDLPQVQLSADIEPFTLAPLLARLQPAMGWQGDLKLGARVNIRAAEKMDADLVFERSEGDLHLAGSEGTQLLGLTDFRVSLTAHEGQWQLVPVFKGRSLGELSGRVTAQTTPQARWPGPQAQLGGELRARVADVGIWGAWVPPGWRLAGQIETTAKLGGTVGQPSYDGELTAQGLAVRNLLAGVNVSEGQVRVKLAGDAATIERFTLKAGDGTATITGGATLGSSFKVLRAGLKLKAERLRVLGRVDRQLIASGEAAATMEGERLQLDGKFRIDEGLFDLSRSDAPSLDEDVTVRRADAPEETRTATEETKVRRNFALGVDVDLGEKLRVRGRGLDAGLRGQLRLTTPGGRLAVNGTITTEGGTYAAYGQKLDIERGILAFSGGYDNPRLDVLALRPNIDQRVGVAITGNVLTPRVRLYAEPELSDSEKLSWLVLGRAPDGLARNDTALLQRAAVALLSGEGEAPTDALMRSLGIDEVSLRQSDGDVRETVITVGKQLSRRWYLGYERGVNATTGTWQLIYRIAQRFTLRAQSGEESALDIIWTWRMQETPADAGMRKSTVTPP
ncbi:translocation/assembly module TamB domain-containing protein [Rubrivivax rivuli]|uniref:DUF490 domain-containing protein n=1 Tax=Rubrivivax rivuli TaxID=1862385 RepID=A0A437RCT7_9BURK|nr:translocation/assembly module TamB domain-containing protein [Rubrivivax rivuli]RVU44560.1 DUF490 domain-containing protein [Rubrivivax rivuli]